MYSVHVNVFSLLIVMESFFSGVVTGLQMKVKAEESLLYSEIERIVLMEVSNCALYKLYLKHTDAHSI